MHGAKPSTTLREVATVGIPVRDQDRALDFYRDTLGFEVRRDVRFGESNRWIELAPPGAPTSVALVQADDAAPAGVRTGIRFTSAVAAADHAALVAAGADVDAEVMRFPVPMFVFRDPDGNTLIAVERPTGP